MSHPISRRTLLVAAATVLAAAMVPLAVSRAEPLARVDVYDRSAGGSLPVYEHRGRRYVEGQPGNEYAIRIRNCSDERLLAVLSVDGVNVLSGETASPDQSGYVIEPGGYVTVQGWRKDLERTAAFYFTDPADSYAGRTGRPHDLGIIGVAVFRERPAVPGQWHGRSRRSVPSPARGKSAADAAGATEESRAAEAMPAPAAQQPSLGTGHGRGEYSPAYLVEFERASTRPDEVVAIRYETREALLAMGVLRTPRYGRHDPDPFPGTMGFVPDP